MWPSSGSLTVQAVGAGMSLSTTGGAVSSPAGTKIVPECCGPQSTIRAMGPCCAAALPVIVFVRVSEARAGSYRLVTMTLAEPPAGIVTVVGSSGVVVTSTVAVTPSTGSSMSHVVPAASPVTVNGSVLVAPAGISNVSVVPPQVTVISTGPCRPAAGPVISFTTESEPSAGV